MGLPSREGAFAQTAKELEWALQAVLHFLGLEQAVYLFALVRYHIMLDRSLSLLVLTLSMGRRLRCLRLSDSVIRLASSHRSSVLMG